MNTAQEKLLRALSLVAENIKITDFNFTEKSNPCFGTLCLSYCYKGIQLKKKIYYSNQKTNLVRRTTAHLSRTFLSAVRIFIKGKTGVENITHIITENLRSYGNGMLAEKRAAELLKKLMLKKRIKSFKKSEEVLDLTEGYDFVITTNTGKEILLDITTCLKTKISRNKNVKLILIHERLSNQVIYSYMLRIIQQAA